MIELLLGGVMGVLTLVWLVLAFAVGYLLLLTFAAATTRRMPPPARNWHTFRIVVPAHNEALMIGPMLQRLFALRYPRTHFDVRYCCA